MNKYLLDHVGYVTNNLKAFEDFWCSVLGFEKYFESQIPDVMNHALFGCNSAYCARYIRDFTIEVHVYDDLVKEEKKPFNSFGLNHIAIWVEDRPKFLASYPFKTHIYHNPKGWDNVFIEDLEGNWIEVRTKI
jgi:catechol 2,3-dioxygenase-like lactoylglutathione lyase family enzyme